MPLWSPRVRALAEVVAGAAALLAFAATSPAPGDPGPEPDPVGPETLPTEERSASLVLHNGSSADAVVRLRRLDAAVDVDCSKLTAEPGTLLSEALLGQTETWTIPAGDNLGIDETPGRSCEVLRIEGDGLAPRWAVWEPGVRSAQPYRPDEEPTGDGVLRLSSEGDGFVVEGPRDLLFVPGELARGSEQCAPVADGQRVAWDDALPEGGLLVSASWGPDGCGSIVFSDDAEALGRPWYLCVPEDAWPFVPGDRVSVAALFASGSEGIELRAEDEARTQRLMVVRTSEATTLGLLDVAYAPDESCGYDVEATCGTVTRVGQLEISVPGGGSVRLAAGEVAADLATAGSTTRTRVEVLAAQERIALDPECALGPDVLGPDVALVVTQSEVEG